MCIPGGTADCGKQLAQKSELYGMTLDALRENRPWQWVYKVFPAMADEAAIAETVKDPVEREELRPPDQLHFADDIHVVQGFHRLGQSGQRSTRSWARAATPPR